MYFFKKFISACVIKVTLFVNKTERAMNLNHFSYIHDRKLQSFLQRASLNELFINHVRIICMAAEQYVIQI